MGTIPASIYHHGTVVNEDADAGRLVVVDEGQEGCVRAGRRDMEAGGVSPTLNAMDNSGDKRATVIVTPLAVRGREGGAQLEVGDENGPYNALRAGDGGSSRGQLIAVFQQSSMDGKGTMGVDTDATVAKPVKTQSDGQMVAVAFGISCDAVDRDGEGRDGDAASRAGLGIVEGLQPALRARANNAVAVAGDYTHALTAEGHDASEDGTGRGTPVIAFGHTNGMDPQASEDVTPTLRAGHDTMPSAATGSQVRRLTPRECERLQGFPDDWTAGQADSSRYRQMGNAVAVPVVEWIMRRLVEVDAR